MLEYSGGLEGPAAVQYDGSLGGGRVLMIGFPFEAVTSENIRNTWMRRALQFFDLLPGPLLAAPRIEYAEGSAWIQWPAIRGRLYQVQFSDAAEAERDRWHDLGSTVAARFPTERIEIDPDLVENERDGRFFRVVLMR